MCMPRPLSRLPFAVRTALGLAVLAASTGSAQSLRPLEPLDASGRVTYFISEGEPGSQFRAADRELATWALRAWERTVGGALKFEPAPEAEALVQVHWVPAGA